MRVPNHLPDFPISSTTFPGKLWRLVNNNLFRSIQWSPEGTNIVINSDMFKKEVLSGGEYGVFKTTNFASFVRQLNLYGFRKTNICSKSSGGADSVTVHYFQHTFFLRNRSDLLCNVRRSSTISKSRRAYDDSYNVYRYHQPFYQQQHTKNGTVYSLLMTDDSNSTLYPYYMNSNNSNNNSTSAHLQQPQYQVSHQVRSSRYSPYPAGGHSASSHQLYSVNRHQDQTSTRDDVRKSDTSSSTTVFPSLEDTVELTALLSANGIALPRFQSKGNAGSVSASMFPSSSVASGVQQSYTGGLSTERRERIQRRYVVQEDIQTLCSPNVLDTSALASINDLIRTSSKVPPLGPVSASYSLPAAPFIHQRYKLEPVEQYPETTPATSTDDDNDRKPSIIASNQPTVETK